MSDKIEARGFVPRAFFYGFSSPAAQGRKIRSRLR